MTAILAKPSMVLKQEMDIILATYDDSRCSGCMGVRVARFTFGTMADL
jgi:hypothetical protein